MNVDKVKRALGKVGDWFEFGVECLASSFGYAVQVLFIAFMVSLFSVLWDKHPDDHAELLALLAICAVIGVWDAWEKRKKKGQTAKEGVQ